MESVACTLHFSRKVHAPFPIQFSPERDCPDINQNGNQDVEWAARGFWLRLHTPTLPHFYPHYSVLPVGAEGRRC